MQALQPYDEHNQNLEANVHPRNWINPEPNEPYQLVVIGAGTAGLVTAAAAAGLGARVALIERDLLGGDCLNVGCVPSKGLIAPARVAGQIRQASLPGIETSEGNVDFAELMKGMREKRARISPVDSAQRFKELGVDVFFGSGRFESSDVIQVAGDNGSGRTLRYKKAVIATGARAAAPPIPGLDSVEYLTNESLFSLTELPKRLGIIGSGPIGCEMAQAFARIGSEVHLFEMADRILPREDEEASVIVAAQFKRDQVNLVLNSADMILSGSGVGGIRIQGNQGSNPYEVDVDQLLVAVGRAPNTNGLNLESVGVSHDRSGVKVNDFLQTTNSKIYAAGDICSQFKFTHSADFQARIVIQNALFAVGPFGRKRASSLIVPWATYTSPEVAHVGLSEQLAREKNIAIDTYRQSFEHVDRAILDGHENGFVKVHTAKGSSKILGATIVAENAGDLISEIVVAMTNKIGLDGIGASIHPYPTHAEAIRRLGDQYNRTRLTPIGKKLLAILRRLNVGK